MSTFTVLLDLLVCNLCPNLNDIFHHENADRNDRFWHIQN